MKKSDFAQKLLDDLRLRKQRLAAANASSASDARGSTFQRPYQGSRAPNTQEITGRRSRNARPKLLAIEDSKEIVPIHRTQNPECISDLSMVLAFALENGGRLGKINFTTNSMAGKKVLPHHLGGQSIDFGDMNITYFSDRSRPSGGRFPHLSQLHIQQISRGAQKLNQILKACSNGVNFDRYLIDVGQELFKGATDLEESLRMLVNLQEASERMVAPRKKRIQLLEGEDSEDEDNIAANKQMALDRRRFSFDGSSRNYLREVAKTSILKLSYPETMNSLHQNSQKQTTIISNLPSHRRSASYDLDSRAIGTISGAKKDVKSDKLLSPLKSGTASSISSSTHTKSKNTIKQPKSLSSEKEKGRIPNVIAKLMGLEELPLELDTESNGVKKAPESKQGTNEISKQKAQRNIKEVDLMTMSSEKPVSQINQQMKVLQANKAMLPLDTAPETVVGEGKQNRTDLKHIENMNPLVKNSQKPVLQINKKVNLIHLDQTKENKLTKQEEQGRTENVKQKEEKNIGKGDHTLDIITQKPVLEVDSQQKISRAHDNPEAEVVGTAKGSPFLKEHKFVKEKVPMQNTQHKPVHENEFKRQPSIQKSEPKEAKHEAAEREQNTKIKLRIKDARSEMMMKNSQKPIHQKNAEKRRITSAASKKKSSEAVYTLQPKGQGNSITYESNLKESANGRLEEQRQNDSKANVEKVAPCKPPIVILKPPRNLSTKKVDNKQVVQISERARTIEEERDAKVGSLQMTTRPLKQQTPILQDLKQVRNERTSEAKEAIESIPPQISYQQRQLKAALPSPPLKPPVADVVEPKKREKTLTENTKNNVIANKAFTAPQLPEISSSEDEDLKSKSKEIPSKGLSGSKTSDDCNSIEEKQQSVPKSEIQEGSLNVQENHLKQILIKSQHFLNAAEAFFNLQIPADILRASYHTHPDKENKLLIDCAYEVMKRKGRREDQASFPAMKLSIVSAKVKSFDDLIKELHEDLGHLQTHGKTEDGNYDAANFLDKMLKRDFQSRNPDANCMWDFGWSDSSCGYLETDEVIKDVEKFLLNRLIDEITRNLLDISIASYTIPVL